LEYLNFTEDHKAKKKLFGGRKQMKNRVLNVLLGIAVPMIPVILGLLDGGW
jgi:hypothetical protein